MKKITILKKNYLQISIFFVFCFMSFNNSYGQTQKDTIQLLCSGKWLLVSTFASHFKGSVENNIWFQFNKDGTYKTSDNSKTYKGTWNYDNKEKEISTINESGKEKLTLIFITKDTLILSTEKLVFTVNLEFKKVSN